MTNREHHLRRYSKTARFLQALELIVDVADMHRRHPYAMMTIGYDGIKQNERDGIDAERRRTLKRLKQQRCIEIHNTSMGLKIVLTDKGIRERFRLRIQEADLFEDERMTMVVFDIPESERGLRQMLRKLLSESGFLPIQRSVWLSPFNAVHELNMLFAAINIRQWIRIFEVRDPST